MTAHAHRAPHRPAGGGAGRARPGTRASGHGPEVLLTLSAVLMVLGGPVARTFAGEGLWLATGSTLLLGVSIVLAALAAWHLLRGSAA